MSKSTKIIAALGIVAGIGAAALPLTSYAAETSANAQLNVNLGESIALKVVGTDSTEEDDGQGGTTTVYSTSSNYNPATTEVSNAYGITEIAGPATSTVAMTANQTNADLKHTATVYTNAKYYTLNLAPAAAANVDLVMDASNKIPAIVPTGSDTSAGLTQGTAAWGYSIDANADKDSAFTPVVADGANIVTKAGGNEEGASTTVTYGVSTDKTQAAGTYTTTLKFTATSANS